jgi:hypothetical protein
MSPEELLPSGVGQRVRSGRPRKTIFSIYAPSSEYLRPADVDRHGTEYTFEKSTRKIGGEAGFADVWKRHCFAWEYKGKRSNLVQAYAQLKQ